MSRNFFHVSCQVEQAQLYSLLRSIEAHKAGNVEVRGVMLNPEESLDGFVDTKVNGYRARKSKLDLRPRMIEAMPIGERINMSELSKKLNAKRTSIYSALSAMMERKIVKRIKAGIYTRVKETV